MTHIRTLAIILLIPFSFLTLYTVLEVGYWGIFEYHIHSPAGWQVFTDLVLALILVLCWMIPDARQSGRNPIPWVLLTLTMGSIGPLLYLVFSPASEPTNELAG